MSIPFAVAPFCPVDDGQTIVGPPNLNCLVNCAAL